MSWLARFRAWCAAPLLAEQQLKQQDTYAALQHEAYQVGYGQGQLQGRNQALYELQIELDKRRARTLEVTQPDLDRVKKRGIH